MKRLSLAALTALLIAVPAFAIPLGNGFTYQGELKLSGSPVNVATDFQFSLWDGPGTGCPPAGGVQLGATQTISNQTVTDGRFTVILNAAGEFGLTAFDGNARWLHIAVRSPGGGGTYTTLCPRQPITATPYSLKVPGIDGHSLDAVDGSPVDAMFVNGSGNVGIGTSSPTSLLHVNGTTRVNGFQMPTGAGDGKLLTSDVSGNATWQTGGGGSLTLPFDGSTSTNGAGFKVTNSGIGDGLHGVSAGVGVEGTNSSTGAYGYLGHNGYGVWGQYGSASYGVLGASGYGAYAAHSPSSNSGYLGHSLVGAFGQHASTGNYGGIGEEHMGAYGVHVGTGNYGYLGNLFWGVEGHAFNFDGMGVFGEANNGPDAVGVWGKSTSGFAGFFTGNARVTGIFSAGTKFFRIDHPLDPENKYLQHSCVESDEMKNVYDGIAALDGSGGASIELPKWFESLNRDFRYQLTAVGAAAPNLHVAQKLQGNRFRIEGGAPGMEVSWQVTGVRQDAFAKAEPLRVELEKEGSERGRYLHPEAFGQPETRRVDYERLHAAESSVRPAKPAPAELPARESGSPPRESGSPR